MKSLVTALAIGLALAFTALTVLAGQTDNSEGLKPVKTGTPDSYGHLTMRIRRFGPTTSENS
jgi:hypothetical protein